MPKIVKPLTDTQLKKLVPMDKEYKLADGGSLFIRLYRTARID
jgi:hypothetical protein